MEHFVRIGHINKDLLPVDIAKSTLYSWQKKNRYPELFKKIGGMILVDLIGLIKLLEDGENV